MKKTINKFKCRTVVFDKGLYEKAIQLVDERSLSSVSSLVQILVNERFEKSGLPEPPVSEPPSTITMRRKPTAAVSYQTTVV